MSAASQKLIIDTLVDIISEKEISSKYIDDKIRVKKGFFLNEPYINSRTTLKGHRKLITEQEILDKIEHGVDHIRLEGNPIITPSARLMIEEGKIKIVR